MEQRTSPRFQVSGQVCVTSLSGSQRSFEGHVLDFSAGGLRLEAAHPLPAFSLVRIDLEDTLLLGEVMWCATQGALCQIGVKLEASLQNLSDIQRLVRSLMQPEMGRAPIPALHQAQAVKACHY